MNQDKPKSGNTAESDERTETSRRHLLAAGAAAVVGATAAAIVPNDAAAFPHIGKHHHKCRGVFDGSGTKHKKFHTSDEIAKLYVKCWHPPGPGLALINALTGASSSDAAKQIMRDNGVPDNEIPGNNKTVKFYRDADYEDGIPYGGPNEVVYVIADKPNTGGNPGMHATARVLMAAVPFGM